MCKCLFVIKRKSLGKRARLRPVFRKQQFVLCGRNVYSKLPLAWKGRGAVAIPPDAEVRKDLSTTYAPRRGPFLFQLQRAGVGPTLGGHPQTPHGRWEGICTCLHRSLSLWGEQRKRQLGFSVVVAPTFSAAGRASEYQPQTDSLVGEVLANALPAHQQGACALLGEGGRFYANRLGKSHENCK